MAEPITSARSQAAIAISANPQNANESLRLKWSRQAWARSRPVTTPSLMARLLQQNSHQIGEHDDGKQSVVIAGATGQIGCPIARIHIADGDQKTRASEGKQLAKPAGGPRNVQAAVDFRKARGERLIAPCFGLRIEYVSAHAVRPVPEVSVSIQQGVNHG